MSVLALGGHRLCVRLVATSKRGKDYTTITATQRQITDLEGVNPKTVVKNVDDITKELRVQDERSLTKWARGMKIKYKALEDRTFLPMVSKKRFPYISFVSN
jgi:hypothetical protein